MSMNPTLRVGLMGVSALLLGLTGASAASAVSDDHSSMLPNTDVRTDQKVAAVAPAASAKLERKLGAEGFVETDPQTGARSFVGRTDGYLTGRSDRKATDIVLGYVAAHSASFGLDGQDLSGLELAESYTSIDGVTHVTYAQVVKGIESFDSYLRGNVTDKGELINISGSPLPDLSPNTTTPSLTADEALLAARANVGGENTVPPVKNRSNGPELKTTYTTYAESAWLTIFGQHGQDRLAWEVQVLDSDSILYRVVVDAVTGEVLLRQSMTAFDSNDANTWPDFPRSDVAPTTTNFGADPTWLDRSAANGNQLIGNNTHTYVDSNGTNGYQAGEQVVRNPGTANWKYPTSFFTQAGCPAFGCSWNSAVAGSQTTNRNPGAVGLFYLTNKYHDHLLQAPIGFDEASRNFEFVNSSGQGVGGDPVLAEAQDSSGTNNADFATPADGTSPRMQMYLWNGTTGSVGPQYDVDGSPSADVVFHEYTHGLTNRLVGNGGGLNLKQSGAMGEGWSDFYAMDYLVGSGVRADAATPDVWIGEYVTGVPGIFGGVSRIRHQAIDCPVGSANANCPASGTAGSGGYTYGDLGKVGTVNGVHDGGEIWSQTMWDLRKALGRTNALKIITGGMRLSSNNPSMLDMRNAILQSAQVNGVNVSTVWSVFAARGFGFFATTAGADANSATEDFSMPPALAHISTVVDDNAPRGDGDGVAEAGETLAVKTTLQNLTVGPLSGVTGSVTTTVGAATRATTSWPTIASGAQGANSPDLNVTLPQDMVCGVSVALTVSVNSPTGAVTVPVKTVPTGTFAVTNSTDVPKAIPDNNAGGVNSTFTIPGSGTVQNLGVKIGRINHTWVGDLKVTLTHGAKSVVLINRIGGGSNGSSLNNIVNLMLDDNAATAVVNATYDNSITGFTGTYRPDQALSAFNGDDKSGTWTLNVVDMSATDTGTLEQWGLGPRACDTFALPSSQTDAASGVDVTVATLNGTHSSAGHATDYRFEWGTTNAYGQTTPVTAGGAGAGPVPVSEPLTELDPSTTYHFRLIALRDGVVLSRGADRTFTTTAAPVPPAPPVDPVAPPVAVKDLSAPPLTITKAPKKKVTTRKAKVKVKVAFTSEAGATFTCKVDKGAPKACTSAFKAKVKAKPGKGAKHVIVIVAKDAAGNSSAPATVRFKAVRKR